jgi:hypothetical protein
MNRYEQGAIKARAYRGVPNSAAIGSEGCTLHGDEHRKQKRHWITYQVSGYNTRYEYRSKQTI